MDKVEVRLKEAFWLGLFFGCGFCLSLLLCTLITLFMAYELLTTGLK